MRGADKATDNSPIRGADPIRAPTMPSGDIDER
jgi:hypothetical protein